MKKNKSQLPEDVSVWLQWHTHNHRVSYNPRSSVQNPVPVVMTSNQAMEKVKWGLLLKNKNKKNHHSFGTQQLNLLEASLVGISFFFFSTSLKAVDCSQFLVEPRYLYIPEDISVLCWVWTFWVTQRSSVIRETPVNIILLSSFSDIYKPLEIFGDVRY